IQYFVSCSTTYSQLYTLSLHDALPISLRDLVLEPAPLIVGIIELAECIGELVTEHEELESLGEARVVAVRLGQRRERAREVEHEDRKSTRLNSSHVKISYAVFCLKKKK